MQNLFFQTLKDSNDEDYFRNYMAYLISPILTGIKPSSIININNNSKNLLGMWRSSKDAFTSSLNLNYITIKQEENKETVLIYNKENLTNILKCNKVKNFLSSYGYDDLNDIDSTLFHLNNRFKEEDCPHEIGIFLGIPLHDVEDFITCKDKPCLLCGYWKVYSKEEDARKLFRKYDLSKELIANCILEGKSLNNLCSNSLLSFSA